MWRWLRWVLLGLVGVIIVAGVVGFMLPAEHEAWRSATFRAAPAAVYSTVHEFAKYPEWRTGVTRMDVVKEPAGVLVTEHGPNGVIPYRIEVAQAPSKLVMRIADPDLGFGGTWTFDITPNDSGSDLVITENGVVSNPFFRVMSKLFFPPTATIETYLADLKRRLRE
jgi:hypothetical protein